MKPYTAKILPALALIGIVIGVNITYNRYRGTGLSRVPEIGAVRLEAATHTDGKEAQREAGVARGWALRRPES